VSHTLAAGLADGFQQRLVAKGGNLHAKSPVSHINCPDPGYLITGADTPGTEDAKIVVQLKEGVAGVNRVWLGYLGKVELSEAQVVNDLL
jgi:hypothetical protein